jgi:zinc protease
VLRWARLKPLAGSFLCAALLASTAGSTLALPPAPNEVLKATLHNGLRVVIVRNTLAPVVSVNMTYLVGSRDDPAAVPGMAHAQEHMMFRGTKNLSTSELGTLATALGGDFNAETADTITQYEFTVPAPDLDAVFRIESDRMHDILDAQSQWENERGAIEQEVIRDESAPGADFFREAQAIFMAGTPYEHQGVGTRAAFDRLTGPELKAFYERWYAPNNALLVLAGNLDPEKTLAQIRARFEAIPERAIPAHAVAHLRPIERVVLHRPTTLVYPLALVGFRMPGVESPDFLASFLLQEVLDSARGPLHALADRGEALDGEWVQCPYVPEAQIAFAAAALRPDGDPAAMTERLEAILHEYAEHGVPRELFESTRRRSIAEQELSRNSISALASDWATTISVDGQPSIAHEQELLAGVTLEQE